MSPITAFQNETNRRMSIVKGKIGENRVNDVLFNMKGFYVFHDVRIDYHQIDHIIVCSKGIFPIETKNFYNCKIVGTFRDEKVERIPKYKKCGEIKEKSKMIDNPIEQTEDHLKKLGKYLDDNLCGVRSIKPILVFANRTAQFDLFSPFIPCIYKDQLHDYLNAMKDIYTIDQCKIIAQAIHKLARNYHNKQKTKFQIPIIVQSI
jgi:hypothetical protein